MAFLGLIFIGLLFGVMLSGIAVGFVVIRSGGPLKESLFGTNARMPALKAPGAADDGAAEPDKRQKALMEELRVTQRLVDQGRIERETFAAESKARQAGLEKLQQQLGERDLRIEELEALVAALREKNEALLTQLSERTEELSRVSLELKDVRTEIEVAESGTTVTNSQVARLQQERDQLAALVAKYRAHLKSGRPAA
jgi:chromosome segregation ATPase